LNVPRNVIRARGTCRSLWDIAFLVCGRLSARQLTPECVARCSRNASLVVAVVKSRLRMGKAWRHRGLKMAGARSIVQAPTQTRLFSAAQPHKLTRVTSVPSRVRDECSSSTDNGRCRKPSEMTPSPGTSTWRSLSISASEALSCELLRIGRGIPKSKRNLWRLLALLRQRNTCSTWSDSRSP
jgi:hypothetical protein